jgi:ASC-1-like (ASCH) protein
MKIVHMSIKREFFNQIKSGRKRVEWRRHCAYYARLLKEKPDFIQFHYFRNIKLLVEVQSVEIVKTPMMLMETMEEKEYWGDWVYKIKLGAIQQNK